MKWTVLSKNAKAEARGSLHKAGSEAQYEYGYDKAAHLNNSQARQAKM